MWLKYGANACVSPSRACGADGTTDAAVAFAPFAVGFIASAAEAFFTPAPALTDLSFLSLPFAELDCLEALALALIVRV